MARQINTKIGKNLNRIKESRGWTIKELADALDCSAASVDNWLYGRATPRKAARALINGLVREVDERPGPIKDLDDNLVDEDDEIDSPKPEPALRPQGPKQRRPAPLSYLDEVSEAVRIAREQGGEHWHILILPIPEREELDIRIGIRKER